MAKAKNAKKVKKLDTSLVITESYIKGLKYNSTLESVVKLLQSKTQQKDTLFFRLITMFYFGQMASTMRADVFFSGRGKIPLNTYVVNLAPSGYGKGHSTYILTHQLMSGFRKKYLKSTFPSLVEDKLRKLAVQRSVKSGLEEEDEYQILNDEFKSSGELLFQFDEATTAALKQFRSKLILGGTAAINFIVDEVGSSLSSHTDVIKTFLELYDVGLLGDKLIKNTKEQERTEQRVGKTPANMLLFGTQSKLFDGSANELLFSSLVTTGLARRCLFGVTHESSAFISDPHKLYKTLNDRSINKLGNALYGKFTEIADESNHGKTLKLSKENTLLVLAYEIYCKKRARELPSFQEDQKAHLNHAYFRTLKMAGIFAFIEGKRRVGRDHIESAIKLNEDSVKVFFKEIMVKEKNYVRLAKYLGAIGTTVTHADLDKELVYYPSQKTARDNMIQMAVAWGATNHISITSKIVNNVEFLRGKQLEKSDLSHLTIAYNDGKSTSHGYKNIDVSFDNLAKLTQYHNFNYLNHHVKKGHRKESKVIRGFDIVIFDVDSKVHIETAKTILAEYKYILYTTKRHTKKKPRFRIIMPLSHKMYMKKSEFSAFMEIMYKWLPFKVDTGTKDRSRKWLSNDSDILHVQTSGKCLQVVNFLPKTKAVKEITDSYSSLVNLDHTERWFRRATKVGNRSRMMIRLALLLVDQGMKFNEIKARVLAFNNTLNKDKLPTSELDNTVFVTTKEHLKRKK